MIKMSSEKERPWYKNLAIIMPIIVAIIGGIGVIFAAYIGIIFIGPELSTVQGIVTDMDGIPVAGAVVEIDGLSSTTDASGTYIMHDVSTGMKTITVRAPGAEVVKRVLRIPKGGEIIIYDFILPSPAPPITPTPSPVVTPSPTPTPTPPVSFVDITKPKEKGGVAWRHMVEGSSSATKDSGLGVYVLIWPIEADGPWWVQPTTIFSDGSWQSYAYFGRDPKLYPEDIGTTYRVVAITTTQKLSGGQTFRELPDSVAKSKEIIVIRTEEARE